MKKKGLLFIVSAPSGAGKTSLCQALLKEIKDLKFSISYTTRPPRPGEIDGEDYFFVDESYFKKGVATGEFIEWAEVHGKLYGTSKKQLAHCAAEGIDIILDIDTQGAMNIQRSDEDGVYIYILPPSFAILEERLRGRGTNSEEEVEGRLKKAADEIRCFNHYDYLIVNEDFDCAKKNLEAIVLAERVRTQALHHAWIEERFGEIAR